MFGRTPNLPSVLSDKLPALEGTTTSETVGNHITALYAARTAFTKAECSERIRRALRKQVRPGTEPYNTGEKVYYKRQGCKEWKGPGTVIGQDGAVVFVRHGGSWVRVHRSRLTRVPNLSRDNVNSHPDAESMSEEMTTRSQEQDTGLQGQASNEEDESDLSGEEAHDQSTQQVEELVIAPDGVHRADKSICLNKGCIVKYQDRNTKEECVAKILSRAGKARGSNKTWYNVRYLLPNHMEGAEISVDLSKVEGLICSQTSGQAESDERTGFSDNEDVLVLESVSFAAAKNAELESWKTNQVYAEVPDSGQKCVSTRWVCTMKELDGDFIPKARLVARGFEELEKGNIPKDSPTCSSESLRMILAVMAQNHWNPNTIDIKTAFLQGAALSRDVFIRPPPEANAGKVVWMLQKCVYGLSDASLQWYNRVKEVLIGFGAEMSRVDPAVFYWKARGHVQGIIACHVDDFIWGGTPEFERQIIDPLRSTFLVGREHGKDKAFSYVGINVCNIEDGIMLQQTEYINNLSPIPLEKCRLLEQSGPLSRSEYEACRSKIGQLLWVARQTRPDVMYDVSSLASMMKHATVKTIVDINKVIRKLKSSSIGLKFQYLGRTESLEMVIFSDSSLGNLPDGGTQGGHLVLLMGEDGRFSPLTWQSKRIRRIVRSTLAGETLALSDGIDSGLFLATLFVELTTGQTKPEMLPIRCITDNKSLYDAVQSTKFVADKRLRLEISNIKEIVQSGQIKQLEWKNARLQLADCLTKRGASSHNLMKIMSDGVWDNNF